MKLDIDVSKYYVLVPCDVRYFHENSSGQVFSRSETSIMSDLRITDFEDGCVSLRFKCLNEFFRVEDLQQEIIFYEEEKVKLPRGIFGLHSYGVYPLSMFNKLIYLMSDSLQKRLETIKDQRESMLTKLALINSDRNDLIEDTVMQGRDKVFYDKQIKTVIG